MSNDNLDNLLNQIKREWKGRRFVIYITQCSTQMYNST